MSLIADRLDRISPSQTIAMRQRAAAMKRAGRDVLAVSSGEPDFATPKHICEAAIRAIEAGETKYTDVAGTPALRRAVAAKFLRDSGIDYHPEEIIVSTGGKQVIFNAMVATLDPGDEVIIPTPTWVSYPDIAAFAGGRAVLVPCEQANGFRLRAQDLEAAITHRTKWFMLNNPCNPTGAVYTADELRLLCDVLLRHPELWIFTDDIYEKLTYDGIRAATVVQVEPRLKPRTVTMSGCSKSYAMTGWRIGFGGAPVELIHAMDKLQGQSTANPSSVSQVAALAALTGPQEFLGEMVAIYRQRRDMVVEMLNAAPGLICHKPQGAFYVFPSIPKGVDDEAFVLDLLEQEGVAAVHGGAFLASGHFRLSYAADTELLREACRRIQRYCKKILS
jgi:aspartate aminotransferase